MFSFLFRQNRILKKIYINFSLFKTLFSRNYSILFFSRFFKFFLRNIRSGKTQEWEKSFDEINQKRRDTNHENEELKRLLSGKERELIQLEAKCYTAINES